MYLAREPERLAGGVIWAPNIFTLFGQTVSDRSARKLIANGDDDEPEFALDTDAHNAGGHRRVRALARDVAARHR